MSTVTTQERDEAKFRQRFIFSRVYSMTVWKGYEGKSRQRAYGRLISRLRPAKIITIQAFLIPSEPGDEDKLLLM